MKTVAAVYSSPALVKPLKDLFGTLVPEARLISLMDDSLIQDVIAGGEVPLSVRRRIVAYYQACEDMGADLILNTCSSLGDIVDQVQSFIGIPILKIDEPMAREAVEKGSRIAVLATLQTTLEPTIRLITSMAKEAGKEITILPGLAEGAFDALVGGNPELHDMRIEHEAMLLAGEADVFVLAQGSMTRMEERLALATGKPVLSSLKSGILAVQSFIQGV